MSSTLLLSSESNTCSMYWIDRYPVHCVCSSFMAAQARRNQARVPRQRLHHGARPGGEWGHCGVQGQARGAGWRHQPRCESPLHCHLCVLAYVLLAVCSVPTQASSVSSGFVPQSPRLSSPAPHRGPGHTTPPPPLSLPPSLSPLSLFPMLPPEASLLLYVSYCHIRSVFNS